MRAQVNCLLHVWLHSETKSRFFQSCRRSSCEFEISRAFADLADKVGSHVRRVAEFSKHLQVADTANGIPQVDQAVGAHHHHRHVGPDAVKLSAEREEEVFSKKCITRTLGTKYILILLIGQLIDWLIRLVLLCFINLCCFAVFVMELHHWRTESNLAWQLNGSDLHSADQSCQ